MNKKQCHEKLMNNLTQQSGVLVVVRCESSETGAASSIPAEGIRVSEFSEGRLGCRWWFSKAIFLKVQRRSQWGTRGTRARRGSKELSVRVRAGSCRSRSGCSDFIRHKDWRWPAGTNGTPRRLIERAPATKWF